MQSNRAADHARMVAQARLIDAYECTHWPRKSAAIARLADLSGGANGLTRADLVPLPGAASRVSEVMSGKRECRGLGGLGNVSAPT
jgi:HTH-type transcriptional regulator/antitoxin HigA